MTTVIKKFSHTIVVIIISHHICCKGDKTEPPRISEYESLKIVSAIYEQVNIVNTISDFLKAILSISPDCSEEVSPGEKYLNCYQERITTTGKIKTTPGNRYTFDLSIQAYDDKRRINATLYTNMILSGEGFFFENLNVKIDIQEEILKTGEIIAENVLHTKTTKGYILRVKSGKIFTKWTDTLNSTFENFEYIQNIYPNATSAEVTMKGIFEIGPDSSCLNPNRINLETSFNTDFNTEISDDRYICQNIKSIKIDDIVINIQDPQVCTKIPFCSLQFQ